MQEKSIVPILSMIFVMMAITLMGCASLHARREAMAVDSLEIIRKHAYSVNVTVVEGENASFPKVPLTGREFKEALKTSIVASKVFSEVVDDINANYFLKVHIFNVSDPPPGGNMHVTVVTNWKLTLPSSETAIWQEVISSSYTSPDFAAFSGMKRIRIALEGAARENIKKGVEKLSKLKL